MSSQEKLERIDKFLLGEMEQEEMEEFQREMESNPALASEVKLQKVVFHSVTDKEAARFQELLGEIEQEREKAPEKGAAKTIRFAFRKTVSIAAAIALVVAAGVYLFKSQVQPARPGSLFAAYFEIPPIEDIVDPALISSVRDRGEQPLPDSESQPLLEVAKLYKNKEYHTALEKLEAIDPGSLENPSNYYYLAGILCLIDGRAEEALANFENVASGFPDGRAWYQALALIKLGRMEEAGRKLEQLVGYANPWREEAERILEGLNYTWLQ